MSRVKLGTIGGIVVIATVLWFSQVFAFRAGFSTDLLLGKRILSFNIGLGTQPLVDPGGVDVKGTGNKL